MWASVGAGFASYGFVQTRSATLGVRLLLFEPHAAARPTSLLFFVWHDPMNFGSYVEVRFEASLGRRIILKSIPIYTVKRLYVCNVFRT